MGMSPYRLVSGKTYYLLVEIGYKARWAVKKLNLDMGGAGLNRLLDINELEELRNDAYFNSKIEKDKLKRWHDQLQDISGHCTSLCHHIKDIGSCLCCMA